MSTHTANPPVPKAADQSAASSGYQRTEVGVIPVDWDVKRLGELFEITSSKRVFQADWKNQGVPFYRARELAVLGESGSVDNELFITPELYERFESQYGMPVAGDMLVTGVGTLGKTYVVPGDHKFYFKDGNIIWFKIADALSSQFLRQLYRTPLVAKQIDEGAAGTTVGTYTIIGAKQTVIPLPPRKEQDAIAEALSDVDGLIGALEKLIAKKRAIKQAAMQQLLTGKTRLPGFTGEWETKRLGEVASFLKGKGLPKSALNPYGVEQCVHYGELFTQYEETISETISKTNEADGMVRSVANDVLMPTSDVTPRGLAKASCVVHDNIVLGGDILVIRTAPDVTNGTFLSHVIRREKDQVLKLVTGTTVFHLYGTDMKNFIFKLPPLVEQQAIVDVLSDMDAEITALEQRRDKTQKIKQGMMQELLTGRVRLVNG